MTTTSSLSLTEGFASPSSNTILTVTITPDDAATSSITPTVSSESVLITDTPATVSSDLTLVYVFTKSATDSSSSSGSSSGSNPPGLSTGAIAGVVIGSIILLIVLVFVVFCTSRRFARKRRREVASLPPSDHQRVSHAAPSSSYHHARSQRSTVYPSPSSPPQELATPFNRLEIAGRGRPVEVLGSYKHPVELHAGSTTELVGHLWKGARPPVGAWEEEGGVIYMIPVRRGDDVVSDVGSAVCLSPPGTWETESWGASVSGRSHRSHKVSGPGTHANPSKASSRETLGYNTNTIE